MTTTINLNNTTPAAPAGNINVTWQNDSSSPLSVSAYVPVTAVTPGGSSGQVQYNNAGALSGAVNLNYNSGTGITTLGSVGGVNGTIQLSGSGSGSATIQVKTAAGSPNPLQLPTTTGAANSIIQSDGNNPQQLSWTSKLTWNDSTSVLTLSGTSSGSAAIQVKSAAGTPNALQLPLTTGSSNQVLKTDGASPQQLSWTAALLVSGSITGDANSGQIPFGTGTNTVTGSQGLRYYPLANGGGTPGQVLVGTAGNNSQIGILSTISDVHAYTGDSIYCAPFSIDSVMQASWITADSKVAGGGQFYSSLISLPGAGTNTGYLFGVGGQVDDATSSVGTMTNLFGTTGQVNVSKSTFTNAAAIVALSPKVQANNGTLTNRYGVYVQDQGTQTVNLPTLQAGVFIASQSGSGVWAINTAGSTPSSFGGNINAANFIATAASAATTGSQVDIGTTTGFGAGAAGTAVTTTTKGAGTGPTTPQTVVNYIEIFIGATAYWIPLVQ